MAVAFVIWRCGAGLPVAEHSIVTFSPILTVVSCDAGTILVIRAGTVRKIRYHQSIT